MRYLQCSILILILSSGWLSAQSVYHDAQRLRKLIDTYQTPQLDLALQTDTTDLTFSFRENSLSPDSAVRYRTWRNPAGIGIYTVKGLSAADTLLLGRDALQLIAGTPKVELEIQPGQISVQLFDSDTATVATDTKVVVDEAYKELWTLLRLHFSATQSDTLSWWRATDVDNVFEEYKSNPFLANYLERPLSADKQRYLQREFFRSGKLFEERQEDNDLQKAYQWRRLLKSDTILNLRQDVSYRELVQDYRKPVEKSAEILAQTVRQIDTRRSKERSFLDATTVAVGLSDFIAQRAKEELNLTFFQRFRKNLDDSPELSILFPESKRLLFQFDVSNYKALLANAREAFETDLKNLSLHFPEVLEHPKYEKLYQSPVVYNLALIYSIADLAYRDTPVDNIMLFTHGKLNRRQQELQKAINLELGKASLSPNGKASGQLASIQKELTSYLERLEQQHSYLQHIQDTLLKAEYNEMQSLQAGLSTMGPEMMISRRGWESELPALNEKANRIKREWKDAFAKSKALRPGIRTFEDAIDYYQNLISFNLSGKEYYEYLLDKPKLQSYDRFFLDQEEDSDTVIVARGIALSRQLLDKSYANALLQRGSALAEELPRALQTKKELLFASSPDRLAEHRFQNVNFRRKLLLEAIRSEAAFLEEALGAERTDYELVALRLLEAMLDPDKNGDWKQVQYVCEEIAGGESWETIRMENSSSLAGTKAFRQLEQLDNDLTGIRGRLERRLMQTQQKFSARQIPTAALEKRSMLLTEVPNISGERALQELTVNFEQQQLALEATFSEMLEQETATEKEKIAALKEAKDAVPPNSEKRQQLEQQIQELSRARDRKEAELEERFSEEAEVLERDFARLQDSLQQRTNTDWQLDDKLTQLRSSSAPADLRSVYENMPNTFLLQYDKQLELEQSINPKQLAQLKKQEDKLRHQLKEIEVLQEQEKRIRIQLDSMELRYCPSLRKAQQNAFLLSKTVEVATILVHAFSDSVVTGDRVILSDTLLTKLELPLRSSGIETRDTFRIIRDTVLVSKQPRRKWVSKDSFNLMMDDPLQRNLFLGLLYQDIRQIEDGRNFDPEEVALLSTRFMRSLFEIDEARRTLNQKKIERKDPQFQDYYPFIRSSVDMISTVITTSAFSDSSLAQRYSPLQTVPVLADQALSMYENIYAAKYGNAVLNTMELFKLIYDGAREGSKKNKKEVRENDMLRNTVLLYGTFMANMLNARTSNEVSAILQAAALPAGSSRVKRESTFNLSINSYLGVGAGREDLTDTGLDDGRAFLNFNTVALSVPIGLSASFTPIIGKRRHSISVFAPLLDVGAITAFRFDNTVFGQVPELEWENLFAPGAFVVYNFQRSPFALGVGGQYGPQLRSIEENGMPVVYSKAWRWPMVFFSIDVPIFNLYTGPRSVSLSRK